MSLKERLHWSKTERPTADSMTLLEHLTELRHRILVTTLAVALGTTISWFLYNGILHVLKQPYCLSNHNHCELYVTGPLDGLSLRLKISLYGGGVLALPVLLWEFWRFVTPGLKSREKRYAIPFVAASIVFFFAGAAMAYVILQHALQFLASIGGNELQQIYNPNQYLSLIVLMMVLFGFTFEFPVVLVALQLARVTTSAQLLGWWRWAIIGITVVSAVFTPSGDPLSMLALAIPLVFFYFAAILVGKICHR